jgi:hypothetical protein
MHFTTTLTASFALLTTIHASPIHNSNSPRAGGPSILPIPSTCTLTSPKPDSTSYQPTAALNSTALLYTIFLPPSTPPSTFNSTICFEQCYGYGTPGESCKAAFYAENALTPPGWFGTAGGDKEIGCLMFNRPVTAEDFEQVQVQGTYEAVQTVNIDCAGAGADGVEKQGRSGTYA